MAVARIFGFSLYAWAGWHFQPCVESTPIHPQDSTHRGHFKLDSMVFYQGVPYSDALAKYVAAFFKMSRSSCVRFSSALSFLTFSRNSSTVSVRVPWLTVVLRCRSQL